MEIEPQVWRIHAEIKKYMPPGQRYVLAVSGGADSFALADAAANVFAAYRERLLVCHVEHGIRGEEALADAERVRSFCAEAGLEYVCCHVDALKYASEVGISLEDAARQLRYRELYAQAEQFGADAVVTAHQADDQAETVLWRLLRGAGTEGLSGMRIAAKQGRFLLLRPLLKLRRMELEEYCRCRGINYCEDSTNDDLQYMRNRIRRELLPYLAREYNPSIKEALLRTAELLGETEEYLLSATESCLQDADFYGIVYTNAEEIKSCWLNAIKLRALPSVLRKRVLRRAYFELGGKELSYERTVALEKLVLTATGGKLIQLPEGISALYKNKKIHFNKTLTQGESENA